MSRSRQTPSSSFLALIFGLRRCLACGGQAVERSARSSQGERCESWWFEACGFQLEFGGIVTVHSCERKSTAGAQHG
eukprot:scaffold25100_cov68-Phaeocystis_antarctica.AAC.4